MSWGMMQEPGGVGRFMGAAEFALRLTQGDRCVFASLGSGEVFVLADADSLARGGTAPQGGLGGARACCDVRGLSRAVVIAEPRSLRSGLSLALRPRPFHTRRSAPLGSGLTSRDWRAYC